MARRPAQRPSAGRTAANGQVKAPQPSSPPPVDLSALEGLSHEELIALVEEAIGGGITVTFSGKANATRIARKVRPRVVRRIKTRGSGSVRCLTFST
jgi:hypothetical protein